MNRQPGFSIVGLLVGIALLLGVGFFVFGQWQTAETSKRDSQRKVAINSLHYYLERSHFPAQKTYPIQLNEELLRGITPEETKDPAGRVIGEPTSDLRYEPFDCNGSTCAGYTLRADLEKEADFIRQSPKR